MTDNRRALPFKETAPVNPWRLAAKSRNRSDSCDCDIGHLSWSSLSRLDNRRSFLYASSSSAASCSSSGEWTFGSRRRLMRDSSWIGRGSGCLRDSEAAAESSAELSSQADLQTRCGSIELGRKDSTTSCKSTVIESLSNELLEPQDDDGVGEQAIQYGAFQKECETQQKSGKDVESHYGWRETHLDGTDNCDKCDGCCPNAQGDKRFRVVPEREEADNTNTTELTHQGEAAGKTCLVATGPALLGHAGHDNVYIPPLSSAVPKTQTKSVVELLLLNSSAINKLYCHLGDNQSFKEWLKLRESHGSNIPNRGGSTPLLDGARDRFAGKPPVVVLQPAAAVLDVSAILSVVRWVTAAAKLWNPKHPKASQSDDEVELSKITTEDRNRKRSRNQSGQRSVSSSAESLLSFVGRLLCRPALTAGTATSDTEVLSRHVHPLCLVGCGALFRAL